MTSARERTASVRISDRASPDRIIVFQCMLPASYRARSFSMPTLAVSWKERWDSLFSLAANVGLTNPSKGTLNACTTTWDVDGCDGGCHDTKRQRKYTWSRVLQISSDERPAIGPGRLEVDREDRHVSLSDDAFLPWCR
jgi:hypothetical protein